MRVDIELSLFQIGLYIASARIIYNKSNEKFERTSKLLYTLAVVVCVPAAVMPPLIAFAIDYFADNLSEKSFYLPIPVA